MKNDKSEEGGGGGLKREGGLINFHPLKRGVGVKRAGGLIEDLRGTRERERGVEMMCHFPAPTHPILPSRDQVLAALTIICTDLHFCLGQMACQML